MNPDDITEELIALRGGFPTRHFDASCTDFQAKGEGRIIKSKRKFGIELELLSPNPKALLGVYKSVPRATGFEHDGSIQRTLKGQVPIEIVSPILSGNLGEEYVRQLFDKINKSDFSANSTCGYHVHLNGVGFKPPKDMRIVQVSDIGQDALEKALKSGKVVFAINNALYEKVMQNSSMSSTAVVEAMIAEYESTQNRNVYLSKALGMTVPNISASSRPFYLGDTSYHLTYFDFDPIKGLPLDSDKAVNLKTFLPQQNDILIIKDNSNCLEKTKTLLYFYVVFSEVFLSMLPQNRRRNAFCQNLSLAFSPHQIEQIQSYPELQKEWYKAKDLVETDRKKENHYDDSRYYGINLHSLFSKYGTVEIRYHAATLSPVKALYWIALHQTILDQIQSGNVRIAGLYDGANMFSIDEKVNFMFRVLDLRMTLRKYVVQRVKYFTGKDIKI